MEWRWAGLVQANNLAAQGNFKQAKEMQDRALEAAPAMAGKINDVEFEWIADEDSRLGPVIVASIDTK